MISSNENSMPSETPCERILPLTRHGVQRAEPLVLSRALGPCARPARVWKGRPLDTAVGPRVPLADLFAGVILLRPVM
jgi:hypothetical protein